MTCLAISRPVILSDIEELPNNAWSLTHMRGGMSFLRRLSLTV